MDKLVLLLKKLKNYLSLFKEVIAIRSLAVSFNFLTFLDYLFLDLFKELFVCEVSIAPHRLVVHLVHVFVDVHADLEWGVRFIIWDADLVKYFVL